MTGDEKEGPIYYNVERFLGETAQSKHVPPPLQVKMLRRLIDRFDPTSGFWMISLSFPFILMFAAGLLVIGLRFGPVAFYLTGAGLVAVGGFVVEKKYGAHFQVEEFALTRRIFMLVPAFALAAAAFIMAVYLAGAL